MARAPSKYPAPPAPKYPPGRRGPHDPEPSPGKKLPVPSPGPGMPRGKMPGGVVPKFSARLASLGTSAVPGKRVK